MKRLLLAGAILLASCAEPTVKDGDIESIFTKEREVASVSSVVISEPLGSNNLVCVVDKYAVVQNPNQGSKFNFHVIDIETGDVVNELFSIGRGRNEMSYPSFIGCSGGRLYIYDQMNTSVVSISTDELLMPSVDLKTEKIKGVDMEDGHFFQTYASIAHNRFVLLKNVREDNDPHILMTPIEDQQFQYGERLLTLGEEDNSDKKGYSYDGVFTTTQHGETMLFTTNNGVYMRFFDCSDAQASPTLIKEYSVEIPTYELQTTRSGSGANQSITTFITCSNDTILGFSHCCADDDNFYLTYRGVSKTDFAAGNYKSSDSSTILVFNKKGEPREKIITDRRLNSPIQYCAVRDSFYTLTVDSDGNDCLIEYKL